MMHTTGEYIAFLDSDDYVDTNMYKVMYEKAKDGEFDIVECNFIWEYPNKKKIDIGKKYTNIPEAIEKARVMACNKLYKREKLNSSRNYFPRRIKI